MRWLNGGLLDACMRRWVPASEVDGEIWRLGSRHQGSVVEPAAAELRRGGLPLRRAVLLRLVITTYERRHGRGRA